MTMRLLSTLVLFAIAGHNQPASAASSGAGKMSISHSLSDSQVEHAIRMKLAKSKLNADHFTVTVVKGVATFEGKTGIMQHKGTATRIAKTSGATLVHNNIRISDEARAKAASGLAKNRPARSAKTDKSAPEPHAALPVAHGAPNAATATAAQTSGRPPSAEKVPTTGQVPRAMVVYPGTIVAPRQSTPQQ